PGPEADRRPDATAPGRSAAGPEGVGAPAPDWRRGGRAVGQPLSPGLRPAVVEGGRRGVRPVARTREDARGLRLDVVRPELPAGPATDRGRRALRAGELEPVCR